MIEKISLEDEDETLQLRINLNFQNDRIIIFLKDRILFDRSFMTATKEETKGLFYMTVRKSSSARTQPFDLIRFEQIKSENSNSVAFTKLYIVVLVVTILVSISISTLNVDSSGKLDHFKTENIVK